MPFYARTAGRSEQSACMIHAVSNSYSSSSELNMSAAAPNSLSCSMSARIHRVNDSMSPSILILGAGCFGVLTAHHLASYGYSNITVLNKDSQVPSCFSAANDLNKVIRAEYADPFYTNLALVCS
ncbi:hypothetical protein ASPVEDRAFT_32250 [Aspergillus versicolor CBS 583.65]|uniref:FAD dependent oxidoreductase domain-containing protein n=1 Tax=Aspergillus versicolor CBS 583.65 TaxID=1036611 RepID=A0A1L9PWK8_ASPVE|nr:uncharacterized protein ASPVEDRAFT_32250 [Aspergillus versicolor CBS 583.65]OJJ05908.1 hypothetical protein ASPVEDRAFT_32250 [Aspergillus versicolor CBS 583.65]